MRKLIDHMAGGPHITIGQFSCKGVKAHNDDSYGVVLPEPSLLQTKGIAMAIADGMSSSEAAKEASESCVKSFLQDYYCTHESWSVKKSAATVLGAINQWLYRQGQVQYLSNRGMVTTFSGAVLKAGLVHLFHAGDSRISLLHEGTIEPLTSDHQIKVSTSQSYLSRAFGIEPDLDVDYRSVAVAAGDVLIFTTDGVHEHIASPALKSIIAANGDNLDDAAKEIADHARANGSQDNLTCQLVRIDHAGEADKDSYFKQLTALPFPPDLNPGQVFEGYRIERELYASKRSQVYLAFDPQTSTRVVIKTPSVNFEDDAAYIELFTREEWIGRRIHSPNVARVIEPKSARKTLYYVTEYVEGQTLREWIDAHEEPPLVEVRGILDQIASGLRAFHRRDMIHQDLKPENIVIDRNDTVKILDFGSTRVAGLEEIAAPIDLPELLGSLDYTAPEYHLGVKPSKLSDIYSLGVIAYEMHTGALPYGRGFASRRDLKKLQLTPAHEHRASLPAWVSGALGKAVQRDPGKRYELLSAFLADLTRPNPEFEDTVPHALLERNPLGFWRTAALIMGLLNLVLIVLLAR